MAQGCAWIARRLGVPCTVVAPDTVPEAKALAVERLGARLLRVGFDDWWRAFETHRVPGVDGVFVHAFDDPRVMAGNGTIGLEILEDLPDVDAVVVPWGGGGLACGIAAAVRALRPEVKVYAAEVETGAPLKASLAAGSPQKVEHRPSFVDGISSRTVLPGPLALAQRLLDGALVVSLAEVAAALRLLAERNHVIAEGAAGAAVAAALSGRAGSGRVAAVVSGGNIDLSRFADVVAGRLS
jgi:threonine dehydratase